MQSELQALSLFQPRTDNSGDMTLKRLIDSLVSLEERVSDMEEILGSYSENTSEMT